MSRFLSRKLFGFWSNNNTPSLDHRVQIVRDLEESFSTFTTKKLAEQFADVRKQSTVEASSVEPRNRAAALGSVAVSHIMGFKLHDIQIKGALATADGSIIQMNTGEGKTLVCALSAIIRSAIDASVHVATTNSYLAERDHQSVEKIFQLLGISSSFIGPDSTPAEIRSGYRKNITYATGYMFGFDYLRDQISLREYEKVTLGRSVLEKINGEDVASKLNQTRHDTIIVDEADSVLIDESTTPLLLSGPTENVSESALFAYKLAHDLAASLDEDDDFLLDQQKKQIELTQIGIERIHQHMQEYGTIDLCQPWASYVTNAIYAEQFLDKDQDYVVADEKIKLVDQNTGRIFDDRSLRAGLHQALEAKEELEINPPNKTLARITRQGFFQLYNNVCGMTGTIDESEDEVKFFYRINVVTLPPNKPSQRIDLPDRFFKDWNSKLAAIVIDIQCRLKSKRPILVGTRSINESLIIEKALLASGIKCQVLNGIQDDEEALIISQAGQSGAITIATNMAGRGTDIKLSTESKQYGGLHVIGAQRFESRRVDRQLAGRAARQGDPGSSQFFISADDQLFFELGKSLRLKIVKHSNENGECNQNYSDDVAYFQSLIENRNFEARKKLVKQEHWLNQVRETVAG